jgi:hypothetical protein
VRLLGTGRLADAIAERLSAPGLVVVVGDLKLARALASRELEVAVAEIDERAATKAALRRVDVASLEAASAAGAVIAAASQLDDGVDRIRALAAAVVAGGVVVLVDKGARTRASRCALLGGLSRLRQSSIARTVVTSGSVLR